MPNQIEAADNFLAHYGVKGMKWGVQRDDAVLQRLTTRLPALASGGTKEERKAANAQGREDWKKYKSSTTSKERRADRKEAIAQKGSYLVEEAMKNPRTLIQMRDPYSGYPIMLSGKEFVDQLSKGAAFDPVSTNLTGLSIGSPDDKK